MYCKCTIFTNLVLYGYGCAFKAKFTAKRYSGLKTYHPGILGVKKSQNYQKTHDKYLAIQLTRGKSDKVIPWDMKCGYLEKITWGKTIKRAICRHFFIWHFLTYLRTVFSIYWLKESYFTALQHCPMWNVKTWTFHFWRQNKKPCSFVKTVLLLQTPMFWEIFKL